jgi:hypothetical protein
MTVKTEKKMIETDIRTYVADDGKEFNFAYECEKYEKQLNKNKLRLKVECIENKGDKFDSAPLDGGEYYESHQFIWYRPKTNEDIDVLNEYYGLGCPLDQDSINQWVCIEMYDYDDPNGDTWVMHLEDSIRHIEFFLKEFGYEVEITKKGR